MARSAGFALGFTSLEAEVSKRALPVEGTVPDWLDGALVRNGPATFEVGGERVAHWFDGLGMLHRFGFADGAVTYTNRFLRSDSYAAAQRGDLSGQFATDAGYFRRLYDLVAGEPTDNCNVHVARFDDSLVALTEVPRFRAVDPETLRDRGEFAFADDCAGTLNCAHVVPDSHRGETVGLLTEFGRECAYSFYRVADGSLRREPIARLPVEKPAYVHSFGLAADYVVLTEHPFAVDPRSFLLPGAEGFVDHFDWEPERGTTLTVLDRASGALVTRRTVDARFVFHHVNAFARPAPADAAHPRELVVDLVDYPDAGVIDGLYLDEMAEWLRSGTNGQLSRLTVPLPPADAGPPGVHVEQVAAPVERHTRYDGIELPRIAPGDRTRPYRYVYGQGAADRDGNHLAKVDVERGASWTWRDPGVFLEEPVFVRAPGAAPPSDEGVVLVTGLDTRAERTVLYALDGATFEELGRAPLPHAVPFGFHGRYFPAW